MRQFGGIARSLAARAKKSTFPAAAGLSVFLIYPGLVGTADVASLASVLDGPRWLANISEAPGESLVSAGDSTATARVIDPLHTGSADSQPRIDLASATMRINTDVHLKREPEKVNRSGKGGRVVSATPKQPPVHFSAGSVVERQSMLKPFGMPEKYELAFVKARPVEEAIKVAFAFNYKKKASDILKPEPDLPVMVASLVEESASNVLAYSPEPQTIRSPFAAVLEESAPINIIPKLGEYDHQWAADPLPKSVYSEREQHCLTAGIYFEARGEPVKGQAAVAQVILNRVRNPTYPDSICGVVYQNQNWRNRCQFSFACDRIKDNVNDPKRWEIAKYVARETTEGRIWLKEVGSSTHYHATYVSPKWARSMKKVGRIGLHIFYRTFGGGWS